MCYIGENESLMSIPRFVENSTALKGNFAPPTEQVIVIERVPRWSYTILNVRRLPCPALVQAWSTLL